MVAHNRIVITGTIAGSIETWSCGIDYVVDGGGAILAPTDVQTWATTAAAVLTGGETRYPAVTAIMGANVNATKVTTYGYGPSGPAVATGLADLSWLGAGTIRTPFSTSMCVTKRTSFAGRSYRGRMYWPALAANVNSDGTFARTQAVVDDFALMFEDLAATGGPDTLIPVVHSATANVVTAVTSVAVGSVLDTQRRRRENVVETYLTAPVG